MLYDSEKPVDVTGRLHRQANKREAGGVPFGIPPASEEGRYSKESRERL